MAPQPLLGNLNLPSGFLNRALPIAEAEGGLASLASIINRFHNPAFGRNYNSWLTPGQYEVLQRRLSPQAGARLRRQINTPAGQAELARLGEELGGVTDFRSTRSLIKNNKLMSYGDNLIPVLQGGRRVFMTPAELRKAGLRPDQSDNTFFNESPRKPTDPWWRRLGPKSEAPVDPSAVTGQTAQSFPLAGEDNPELMALLFSELNPGIKKQIPTAPTSSFSNFLNTFGPIMSASSIM